jgi:antitoxin component YwqK of YwqJK toxin-antitoxin module
MSTLLRIFFIAILLSVGNHAFAGRSECKLSSVNILDRNGFSETISSKDRLKNFEEIDYFKSLPYEKVLRIYSRDSRGDIHCFINTYYPNGQPKQYLEIVNGRAYGMYREWHSNGKVRLDATVIGGDADIYPGSENTWIFDDWCCAWDEDEKPLASIYYKKGSLEETAYYYHNNGKIWKQIPYKNNLIDGTAQIFLDDGSLLQSMDYVTGKRQGLSLRYWKENRIAANEEYEQDKLQKAAYYDLKGSIVAEIEGGNGYRATFGKESIAELQEYNKGVLNGKVKSFNKDGRLVRVTHIKNDRKHGEEIDYFVNNKPKLLVTWYEGKIQGPTKTWYENGNQESQREMHNNQKNGLLTAWYKDGSLMLIEEYEHGKTVKGSYFKRGENTPISQVYQGNGTATLYDSEGNFNRKVTITNGFAEK